MMTTEEAARVARLMLAKCGPAERPHIEDAIARLNNLCRTPPRLRLVVDNTAPPPPCDTEPA